MCPVHGTCLVRPTALVYDGSSIRLPLPCSTALPARQLDETCLRADADADDYYRSKILADRIVLSFLEVHPEMHACMVLPGWMWGPADIGPTSSGQLVNDVVRGKLPGPDPR